MRRPRRSRWLWWCRRRCGLRPWGRAVAFLTRMALRLAIAAEHSEELPVQQALQLQPRCQGIAGQHRTSIRFDDRPVGATASLDLDACCLVARVRRCAVRARVRVGHLVRIFRQLGESGRTNQRVGTGRIRVATDKCRREVPPAYVEELKLERFREGLEGLADPRLQKLHVQHVHGRVDDPEPDKRGIGRVDHVPRLIDRLAPV